MAPRRKPYGDCKASRAWGGVPFDRSARPGRTNDGTPWTRRRVTTPVTRPDRPVARPTGAIGCGPWADGNSHGAGRVARQYARKASSKCCGEDGIPILASLALLDANGHPRRIEVTDAQVQELGEPQARRVGRQNHRAMLLIPHVRDQPLDFGPAQGGSVPGRRGDGTLNVMRSRFSVV